MNKFANKSSKSAKIRLGQIKIDLFNKLKQKNKRKKKKITISLKSLRIYPPIIGKITIVYNRPIPMIQFEKKIIGIDLKKLSNELNSKFNFMNFNFSENTDSFVSFYLRITVKYNLSLIISSLLQTITIRRK